MMESIDNGRAKISSSMNGTEVSIPSKKNWFILIFSTAWLGGWYFGFKNVLGTLKLDKDGFGEIDGFMAFWLIGWTIGGLFIIGLLFWGYFGKEILKIESKKIILNKSVFGIGTTKILKKTEVKNIRFNEVEINYFSGKNNWAIWGVGEGKIKFDYGMKTYYLGLGLDDAEANYLVEKIQEETI
jgi:hypothetical protein